MKWLLYQRGTIHLYRIDMVLRSVFLYAEKMSGIFIETFYTNEGPNLRWSWNEKQIRNLGKIVLQKCSTEKGLKNHLDKAHKYNADSIQATEKIRKMDLAKLSDDEIIKLYDFLDKNCLNARAMLDTDIDAVDIMLEEFLLAQLKKELPGNTNYELSKLYKQISKTVYQSYTLEQEREIIKLALKKKVTNQDINKLYNKFWWTSLGWESTSIHSKDYFVKAVAKTAKREDLKQQLAKMENHADEVENKRMELITKYNLSAKIRHWFLVIDKYNKLHDERKETQVKAMHAYLLLMYETARRLKLSKNDLEWLFHAEVKDLLKGERLDKAEVARRKKAICVLVTKKGIKTLSGKKAKDFWEKELKLGNKQVSEFKGMGVTNGKVMARVKVCAGAQEALKKVQKGDILVCPMTLPEYVPAMKKSAAIVTNEGGITCHAAIISREFNIPCVVGTKIATNVLEDGDKVEVDANNGVIKILK